MCTEREYWLSIVKKLSTPVLDNLANRTLKKNLPIREGDARFKYANLEVSGRLLAGIAPWLETQLNEGEEDNLRSNTAELSREAIDAGTDPASPDYFNLSVGSHPVVDAAFLAHAFLLIYVQ